LPIGFIGSPDRIIERTFTIVISLDNTKNPKKEQIIPNYRNPLYVAKEYARMIETGEAGSESDLARKMGISRVRVNHFITLLKLAPEVIQASEDMGDPMPRKYVSERKLRSIAKIPDKRQIAIIKALVH